jgi:chemotaxis protein methyltransferase CheR
MRQTLSKPLPSSLADFLAAQIGLNFPRERWGDLERGIAAAAREFGAADVESYARLSMGIGMMLSPQPGLAAGALLGKFPGADPRSRLYG